MTVSSPPNSPLNKNSGARTLLRQATHEHHNQLNRHPLLIGVTQPEYLLQDYLKLLNAYFGLYQAVEKKIMDFLAVNTVNFDYQPRLKSPWLQQDLTFFQFRSKLPSQNAVLAPDIKNLGDLVGMLYVIEGSTLGGQLISKHLTTNLGITPKTGGRFFGGYGENTAHFWADFLQFAANIDDDAKQCLSAKNMACETFCLFLRTLDEFSLETA